MTHQSLARKWLENLTPHLRELCDPGAIAFAAHLDAQEKPMTCSHMLPFEKCEACKPRPQCCKICSNPINVLDCLNGGCPCHEECEFLPPLKGYRWCKTHKTFHDQPKPDVKVDEWTRFKKEACISYHESVHDSIRDAFNLVLSKAREEAKKEGELGVLWRLLDDERIGGIALVLIKDRLANLK